MKQRKIPEDLSCGLNVAMKIIGAKWKPCIIDAINRGFTRPSEMHRQIASATPRVIDMQLRELEKHGIVAKTTYFEVPLRTEYRLTPEGKSLLSLIAAMQQWGDGHKYLLQPDDVQEGLYDRTEKEHNAYSHMTGASESFCVAN